VKIGNFTRKGHTKITAAQSTEITSMTTADFSDKRVVSNQSNSTNIRVITVLQRMYLGCKGNAKILIKKFSSLKNNIGAALHTVHMIQLR
jgi:hypothetical protein